jgi:hypothetical protein
LNHRIAERSLRELQYVEDQQEKVIALNLRGISWNHRQLKLLIGVVQLGSHVQFRPVRHAAFVNRAGFAGAWWAPPLFSLPARLPA